MRAGWGISPWRGGGSGRLRTQRSLETYFLTEGAGFIAGETETRSVGAGVPPSENAFSKAARAVLFVGCPSLSLQKGVLVRGVSPSPKRVALRTQQALQSNRGLRELESLCGPS